MIHFLRKKIAAPTITPAAKIEMISTVLEPAAVPTPLPETPLEAFPSAAVLVAVAGCTGLASLDDSPNREPAEWKLKYVGELMLVGTESVVAALSEIGMLYPAPAMIFELKGPDPPLSRVRPMSRMHQTKLSSRTNRAVIPPARSHSARLPT